MWNSIVQGRQYHPLELHATRITLQCENPSSEPISRVPGRTSSCTNQDKYQRDSNRIKVQICYSAKANIFKFQMFCRIDRKITFYFYQSWNFLEEVIVVNPPNLIFFSGNMVFGLFSESEKLLVCFFHCQVYSEIKLRADLSV